ncbi:MAG: hypothetical protein WBA12_12860 [Catalinimonas sp.]
MRHNLLMLSALFTRVLRRFRWPVRGLGGPAIARLKRFDCPQKDKPNHETIFHVNTT